MLLLRVFTSWASLVIVVSAFSGLISLTNSEPCDGWATSALLISTRLPPSTVSAAEQGPDTYLLNKQISKVTQL